MAVEVKVLKVQGQKCQNKVYRRSFAPPLQYKIRNSKTRAAKFDEYFVNFRENRWKIHRTMRRFSAFESFRWITIWRLRFQTSTFVTVAFKVMRATSKRRRLNCFGFCRVGVGVYLVGEEKEMEG